MALSTILAQDVFGTAVGVVGQDVLVRCTVTTITGSGTTAQILCTAAKPGALGDLTATITVGMKQFSTPTHATGAQQSVFGTYLDATGRTALVRASITSVSGSGELMQITAKVKATGELGDTANSITVGPKQLSAVVAQ